MALILFCYPLHSTSSNESFSSTKTLFLPRFLCVRLFNLICPRVLIAPAFKLYTVSRSDSEDEQSVAVFPLTCGEGGVGPDCAEEAQRRS